MTTLVSRIGWILIPLALWEFIPRTGVVSSSTLPPFSDVIAAAMRILGDPESYEHISTTLAEVLIAFVIVVPLAVVSGYLIGLNSYVRSILEPIVSFFVGVPKSIFLPLLILALGLGITQKVAFGVLQAVFIVTVTMIAGMREIPDGLQEYTRTQRASRWQDFWHLYRPAVTPVVVEGVRLGMIYTMTGVLLAEMYASRRGLGQLIAAYGTRFDIESLLAVVLIVAVISIIINVALAAYGRRVGRWRTG